MSTASAVTLSLVNDPRIYHGFWHSYGSSFPLGPALTVNTKTYAFLASGLTLFTAWVASRAWVVINVLIFISIYKRTKMSLEESQCAAFLANSRAPLGAVLTAGKLAHRGGPRKTLIKIIWASFFILSLKATIPFFVALFPIQRGGLLAPISCGADSTPIDEWGNLVKFQRFSDAALSFTDRNISSVEKKRGLKTLAPLPRPTQSYTPRCPTGVICHPDFPFTFSSTYNLTSQHFGFNIDIPISLQVSETCYRPTWANFSIPGTDPLRYGLFYGPAYNDGIPTDYTTYVYGEQSYSPGYTLIFRTALTDNTFVTNYWEPNSTLLMGGDTTILFYFIGWIQSPAPIDDPVFVTNSTPSYDGSYRALEVVAPIVCDTKYRFCADKKQHDCSPIGPTSHVADWLQTTKRGSVWEDMVTFFNGTTLAPPISQAAFGSGAIAAAQTLQQAWIQSDPGNNTIARELGRLSRAGMAVVASIPQLASLGFWDLCAASDGPPDHGLRNNVVIESNTAVSILLTPYYLFFCFSAVIVIISYADVLRLTNLRRWQKYKNAWALYSVGQLHRQVAEQQCGQLHKAEPRSRWPDLSSGPASGFEVMEKNGSMYLTSPTSPGAKYDVPAFNPALEPMLSLPPTYSYTPYGEQSDAGHRPARYWD